MEDLENQTRERKIKKTSIAGEDGSTRGARGLEGQMVYRAKTLSYERELYACLN